MDSQDSSHFRASCKKPQQTRQSDRYEDAIAFLDSRNNFETLNHFPYRDLEKRLRQLRTFLDSLGAPDGNFTTIHITGTKGKGSTGVILETILSAAGYKVGRFSSPHLHSLMERFTIDGVPCREEIFTEILLGVRDAVIAHENAQLSRNRPREPFSYFDLLVLVAMLYFSREKVRCVILEVGLGGRLDSTNACHTDISIITSISFDHVEQLGPTLADIAREKAGIIRPRTPVISGVEHAEAGQVIRDVASRHEAPLYEIGRDFQYVIRSENPVIYDYRTISRKMDSGGTREGAAFRLDVLEHAIPGVHQVGNASAALTAIFVLREQKGWKISGDAIRRGLKSVRIPARIELLRKKPYLIVDGAHNRASIRALLDTVATMPTNFKTRYLLFGALRGKDIEGMLEELMPCFDRVVFTRSVSGARGFPPAQLSEAALRYGKHNADPLFPDVIEEPTEALERLLHTAGEDDLICVCGSFYLAATIRERVLRSTDATTG